MFTTHRAITIRQPYAYLVAAGIKDVENRTRRTSHRGPLLIHASKATPEPELVTALEKAHGITIPRNRLYLGGLVGVVDLVDVVESHESRWFRGPFGYVVANARQIPFLRWSGQLGIWHFIGTLQ